MVDTASGAPAAGTLLDMRLLPRHLRPGIVVTCLKHLRAGERVTVVDDQESPLQVRIETLGLPGFEWRAEERGPEVWRTVLTRLG